MITAIFGLAVLSFQPVEIQFTHESSLEWIELIRRNANDHPDWMRAVASAGVNEKTQFEKAECVAKVMRPEEEDELPWETDLELVKPETRRKLNEVTRTNEIACRAETNTHEALTLSFSLAGIPIKAWGNRFTKGSFSIKGEKAKTLFKNLADAQQSENPLNLPFYNRKAMCEDNADYCWEEFVLQYRRARESDGQTLGCVRDTYYEPKVFEDAKQIVMTFRAEHPTPSENDYSELNEKMRTFFNGVWGDKQGYKAFEDQIARKVRRISNLQCDIIK